MGPLLRGQTVSVKGTADSELQLCLGISTSDSATLQSSLHVYSHSNALYCCCLWPTALSSDTGVTSSLSPYGGLYQDDVSIPSRERDVSEREFECFLLDP